MLLSLWIAQPHKQSCARVNKIYLLFPWSYFNWIANPSTIPVLLNIVCCPWVSTSLPPFHKSSRTTGTEKSQLTPPSLSHHLIWSWLIYSRNQILFCLSSTSFSIPPILQKCTYVLLKYPQCCLKNCQAEKSCNGEKKRWKKTASM